MMDATTNLIIMYWYRRHLKRLQAKPKRKYWLQPRMRKRSSSFHKLMAGLREDETKFAEFFNMSSSTFEVLLMMVQEDLTKMDTNMRDCITPEEKLAICLRYFVTGCVFRELHMYFLVGISTISHMIRDVSKCIWNNLKAQFIKMPSTAHAWHEISHAFEARSDFPHCVGAIAGKRILNSKPRKYSIILLVVVDADYRFMHVEVGSYKSKCNTSVYRETTIWKNLIEDKLSLPRQRPLTVYNEKSSFPEDVPYVFVGSEGFDLHENLMTPYSGARLDNQKKIFNYRLSNATRYAHYALRNLFNKWRILQRPLDVSEESAILIVQACTVLHNFVSSMDDTQMTDTDEKVNVFEDVPLQPELRKRDSLLVNTRTKFAEYFVSESGAVPWQNEILN